MQPLIHGKSGNSCINFAVQCQCILIYTSSYNITKALLQKSVCVCVCGGGDAYQKNKCSKLAGSIQSERKKAQLERFFQSGDVENPLLPQTHLDVPFLSRNFVAKVSMTKNMSLVILMLYSFLVLVMPVQQFKSC